MVELWLQTFSCNHNLTATVTQLVADAEQLRGCKNGLRVQTRTFRNLQGNR